MRFYENTKKDNSGVNALIETKEPEEPIDNTSNIVKFPDGYSMEVHPARNGKVLYILKDPQNREDRKSVV